MKRGSTDAAGRRQPMAVAVIGGLLASTFLGLIVAPVVFALVDDVEHRIRCAVRRRQASQAAV